MQVTSSWLDGMCFVATNEQGHSVVMEGAASDLANNEDVKEFYLGMGGGERKSFKDGKSYKRRKRWLA